jgi:hypothetical protein
MYVVKGSIVTNDNLSYREWANGFAASPLRGSETKILGRKEKGTKRMYDSQNTSAKERHEFVTRMEEMRIHALSFHVKMHVYRKRG